jgi:hypothetical protein
MHLLCEWNIEYLSESTTDGTSLTVFFHYWLFKKKGWIWKFPKLIWLGIWRFIQRSYENGNSRQNARSLMPVGYLVIALRS